MGSFCRVVDNHGDLGVCWRLAADLGSRGERCGWGRRCACTGWMAPQGSAAPGVELRAGRGGRHRRPGRATSSSKPPPPPPRPAGPVRRAMAARTSAGVDQPRIPQRGQPYVARSHGLPSPQRNGLVKRFFYPGFDAHRRPAARARSARAQRPFDAGLARRRWGSRAAPASAVSFLFCYDNRRAPAPALLARSTAAQRRLLLAGRARRDSARHRRHARARRTATPSSYPI